MFDLSAYNTFNLTVYAQEGRVIATPEDLAQPVRGPFIILGGGSDVLFTEDFAGTVLINRIMGIEYGPKLNVHGQPTADDNATHILVRVGGGVLLDDFIATMIAEGICGLENLSLIPGTVGAAPIQNVGAYGVEIGELIACVEAREVLSGKCVTMTKEQCRFSYRSSIFKEQGWSNLFITHVIFKLPLRFTPQVNYAGLQSCEFKNAAALRARVIALRTEKLPNPKYVGNAGSFFKNPYVSAAKVAELQARYGTVPCYLQSDGRYKLAAGWLIDQAHCRGIKHGQVGTWGKQALVIVNLGGAKPHEVVALAKYVSAEVRNQFALDLVPEVRLYGKHGEISWDQI